MVESPNSVFVVGRENKNKKNWMPSRHPFPCFATHISDHKMYAQSLGEYSVVYSSEKTRP